MATRAIKNEKVRERLLAFELLVQRGESSLAIRARMKISRATYYRWLSQIDRRDEPDKSAQAREKAS